MKRLIVLGALLMSACSSSSVVTSSPQASFAPSSPSATAVVVVSQDPCHQATVTFCVLNPAVTQGTINMTICVSGWTKTIRPSSNYTSSLKAKQMIAEGLQGPASAYEEDHRLPLELGGAPSDPFNLSPEAHSSSFAKDAAENDAKALVCGGANLRVVQTAFIARWLAPYPGYN